MPTRPVTLLLENGSQQLSLETLISSSPVGASHQVLVRNNTDKALSLHFALSEDATGFVSLTHRYDQEDIGQDHAGHPGNLNLVYSSFDHAPDVIVAANATEVAQLHFVAQAPQTIRNPCGANALKPFAAALHALDDKKIILTSLPISGTLCESNLQLDSVRLDYGHCKRLDWTYRELRVRNLSPVATNFCLSSGMRSSADNGYPTSLRFLDTGTGKAVNTASVDIGANEVRVLRVGFRPEGAAKEEKWFSVENLSNPNDLWHVRVFANARADRIAQTIDVDCGSSLDFGDCFASCPAFRDVTLISKGNEAVKVTLVSDRRHQIRFEVLQDWSYDDMNTLVDKTVTLREVASRLPNPHHASRLNDVFDRPLSPLGSIRANSMKTSGEELTQSLEALKKHSSGPVFSSFSSKQADSRDHATPRQGLTRTRLGEHVLLAPGQKRRIRIWYTPHCVVGQQDKRPAADSDLDRGRLLPDTFQLSFKLPSGESRVIEGRSRVCESILRLERENIHLGDCNVLTKYKTVLSVINCSDLCASAAISYVSQCVVADAHQVRIGPRETYDLILDFIPRQVNPLYHKEITITNLWNPKSPNLIFTLRANCIDRQGISLHALFYKILAPNPTNEIDFGVTVANHPAIRAFRVRNLTKQKLILRFSGSNGVQVYMPSRIGDTSSLETLATQVSGKDEDAEEPSERKPPSCSELSALQERCDSLRLLRALVDYEFCSRSRARVVSRNQFGRSSAKGKTSCELQGHTGIEHSFLCDTGISSDELSERGEEDDRLAVEGKQGWAEFLECLEGRESERLDSMPMFFSDHDSELSYTERQFRPARRLRAALQAGYLSEGNILELSPEAESLVVVSMVLADVEVRGKTKTRPFEKRLVVQMLAFDNTRLSDAAPNSSKEFNDIAKRFENDQASMPREILLTVQACKSCMQIEPLRQLNFGTIPCGEQKDKVFTIVNMSEAPLLYKLRKSGTGTSDDLRFNLGKSTQGVVRPYFSKLVPFIYAPTKEGAFEERIVVENRLDKAASCELVVRAFVANRANVTNL